jgi:aspartyl protease family protein
MRNVVLSVAAVLFVAGYATQHTGKIAKLPSGSASQSQSTPTVAKATSSGAPDTYIVPADRSGHFHLDANVQGRRVPFLVDTGASIIALRKEEAERLGVNPSPRDFKIPIRTANGVAYAARVRLASVEVGTLVVQDVEAVVMPAGKLGENLLGMSFLSRLRRFEFRTGQLVLEQ